jgi:hypothetical protein
VNIVGQCVAKHAQISWLVSPPTSDQLAGNTSTEFSIASGSIALVSKELASKELASKELATKELASKELCVLCNSDLLGMQWLSRLF